MRLISTSRCRSVGGDWVSTIRRRSAGETDFHDSLSECR